VREFDRCAQTYLAVSTQHSSENVGRDFPARPQLSQRRSTICTGSHPKNIEWLSIRIAANFALKVFHSRSQRSHLAPPSYYSPSALTA
jgi:hypothetical protein